MEMVLDFNCPLCNMPVSRSWEFSRVITCPYCKHNHNVAWTYEDLGDGVKTHIEIITYLNGVVDGVVVPYRVSTIEKEI